MIDHINHNLIAILRTRPGTNFENTLFAIKTAFNLGIKAIEITANSEYWQDVVAIIHKSQFLNKDQLIGVGSIKNKDLAQEAILCGAQFLVSPGIFEDAIKEAHKNNIPILPGIFTPTEAKKAKELNIKDQKFFPANVNNHIELLNAIHEPFRDEFKSLINQGYKIEPFTDTEFYSSENQIILSSPTEFYTFYTSKKNPKISTIIFKLTGKLGLEKINDILDPEKKIRTYAVGRINFKNMKEVLSQGAYGICLGNSIFNTQAIFSGDKEIVQSDLRKALGNL